MKKIFFFIQISFLLLFNNNLISQTANRSSCSITSASCNPTFNDHRPSFNLGIVRVQFGTIDKTTDSHNAGNPTHEDFTCTDQTNIIVGVVESITITNSNSNPENVKVYIDWNNDGDFLDTDEEAFSSVNASSHTGTITAPVNALQNTLIRMRVLSDWTGSDTIDSACENIELGQVEDYGIIVLPDTPSMTTSDAITITKTSAELGGNVTNDSGNSVTERGVVYSTTDTTPEIGETEVTKETNGTGTGVFTENITGLTKGSTYYYRAYATNSKGTGYGTVKSFTTLNNSPTITTTDPTAITATSATLAGNIVDQGDSVVTERGIVYSTTDTNPKIGDTGVTKDDNATETDAFSENINGLTTNTTYYYRAYATNTQGTAYGTVKTFLLNNALNFDGINDRITIADPTLSDFSSGITVEAWINPNVLAGQVYLSRAFQFSFKLLASGRIEFTITSSDFMNESFESSTTVTINTGTWYHIAFTFDGTTMRGYINGIDVGSKAVSKTIFNSFSFIVIGANNNTEFFNGNIDEVRIWTRALTATEILAQKDKNIPSSAPNLLAYYKMNQGITEGDNSAITTLTDSGPNNILGDLKDFTKSGATSNFVLSLAGSFENGVLATNIFNTTGNWSTASNWSLGVVPTQVDKVIIGAGKTVTIDVDNLKVDDFTLETTAILNIPKDKEITIQNSFTSNGALELGSDKNDSGVLFVEGTSTGNITYKRGGLLANKWSLVTPPVSGQTIKTFAENAANAIRINTVPDPDKYAIGYYDNTQASGNRWQYYDVNVPATTEFIAGNSYAISRATDGEVSFTGTLTVNNLVKTLVANKWNTIGNPFTTYYPANKNSDSSFLNDNITALDDAFKSLYVWDNAQNKYVTVSEVDTNARSLTPGQGFFVFMKTGQTEITFNAAKRSTKPGSGDKNFARSTNTTPNIVLKVSNNINTVKTDIKYFDTATLGLDPGYDIGNFNGASLDVYTHLLENSDGTNFTIQSLPTNNYENMIVPLGLKASKGEEITFTAEALNLPTAIDVYLEDREKNTFVKLSEEANSNYTIVLESAINNIGRFYIHTTSQVLNTDKIPELTGVHMYTVNNVLKIYGLQKGNANLKMYSILGKQLFRTQFTAKNTTEILLTKLASGIYIVQLQTAKGVLNTKITIE